MKERILFESYTGSEPYIFLRFDKADGQTASGIVNTLIDKQFRVCYNEYDNKTIEDSEWVAGRMLPSQLVIFLISAGSLKNLAFRNGINYALSKNKKVFCIYLDDEELDDGIAMQLSNVSGAKLSGYQSIGELCEGIMKTDSFIQEMRGDDVKNLIKHDRKKRVAIAAMAVVLVLFFAAAAVITVYRINYENSLAGRIEKMTETDYLDISNEDASTIELLKGKTIKTLVARNMDLTDIEALQYVNCEELDISQNPKVNTLEPLLENGNFKTVTVTQDMYPAIVRVSGRHEFRIIIDD